MRMTLRLVTLCLAGLIASASASSQPANSSSPPTILVAGREDDRAFLRTEPFWVSVENRLPDVMERALDARWEVRSRGGTDAEANGASRRVVIEAIPRIMRNASDELLDEYLALALAQGIAARNASVETCVLLARGGDITTALPPEMIAHETRLLRSALESAPNEPVEMDDSSLGQEVGQLLAERLPADQLRAITNPDDPSVTDEMRCESAISSIRILVELPRPQRVRAARFIYARPTR